MGEHVTLSLDPPRPPLARLHSGKFCVVGWLVSVCVSHSPKWLQSLVTRSIRVMLRCLIRWKLILVRLLCPCVVSAK